MGNFYNFIIINIIIDFNRLILLSLINFIVYDHNNDYYNYYYCYQHYYYVFLMANFSRAFGVQ